LKADTRQQEIRLPVAVQHKWMTESRQEKLMWLRAQMKLTSQCWALKELAKIIQPAPWSEERRSDWQ
jgi:hypothetical protein